MGRNGKLLAILALAFMLSSQAWAQTLWAEVTFDKNSVYVGQPVSVSVKVFSSTWFTTGLDLGNIKVEGAFSVYFRSVSSSFQKDGNTYSSVELIYNVFPFETGELNFPALAIEAESPAPGDYKGTKHVVNTKSKILNVKPAPAAFSTDQWLVANGLQVYDSWSGDRQHVKVGDVLERQISRTAYGTVSQLIPPIKWDSLANVSEYPSRSKVENQKDKTSISSTRTESMRYLFEKEGEITIPEIVFTWYNPSHEKLYKRTLKAVTFDVAANPDLGVLTSIRDSLQAIQKKELAETAEKAPLTILGMSLKKLAVVVVVGVLILILLFKLIRKLVLDQKERRAAYLISESFYFHEFKKAMHGRDQKRTTAKLYRWIDALDLAEPSATCFAKRYGSDSLQRQVATMEAKWGKGDQFSGLTVKEWESARKNYLNRGHVVSSGWINPD
ncbi:BatD family protein [Algoriphagus chordae]|uniref:Oxygen tolerance protein BatD n=1 Tax=Algoriphagus chordae TaxID=237019 RepID=A0A2W7QXW1_9BACT|nr:BatD family protein [Algoriphagus chordae]PZX48517.1 oxygen tolerance protein BatD [Algoriphagus chordae]